ncbi:SNF2 family N-terminal domain-containing protein [Gaertneriomyces semiglobifer]|nr:SNF2 family N-terminal domain-containing protein [Gaertneriomyces semiglobifer]
MTTRLERLVLLLHTGTTQIVRNTAAQQIGEIQKQQPDQLYHLLGRVLVHLRSPDWHTRVAAGLAIEEIAKSVPQWDPPAPVPSVVKLQEPDTSENCLLTFDDLDIRDVVENSSPLLSSAGKEFDPHFEMDPKERIDMQRRELRARLGIGTEFMKDLVEENDVAVHGPELTGATPKEHQPGEGPSGQNSGGDEEVGLAGLSARERALRKRKLRMGVKERASKVRVVDVGPRSRKSVGSVDAKPVAIKVKHEDEDSLMSGRSMVGSPVCEEVQNANKVVIDPKIKMELNTTTGNHEIGTEWPFEGLCEQLCLDLFSPSWETRHGAAVGLRSILKHHGSGCGRLIGLDRKANIHRHRVWLEDCAVRLVCVLALDRFGDYGNDQAVAPVRETAAQALGVVMQCSPADLCMKTIELGLLKLLQASGNGAATVVGSEWQVRHGALVGLKYWMAVRQDLLDKILMSADGVETQVFQAIVNGLQDSDDSVRAVASSSLLPVSKLLTRIFPTHIVFHSVVLTLWDSLQELDDLTSATSSVMDLLSQLMTAPGMMELMRSEGPESLQTYVTRLYPFFRHAIVAVRQAVLRTVSTFIDINLKNRKGDDVGGLAADWISPALLRLIFQNFVIEDRKEVIAQTLDLWLKILQYLESWPQLLKAIASPVLAAWFDLVFQTPGRPLNLQFFYFPLQQAKQEYKVGKKRKIGADHEFINVAPHDKAMSEQDLTVISVDDIMHGRLAGASALGHLVHFLLESADAEVERQIKDLITAYLTSSWCGHRLMCNIMLDEWAFVWSLKNESSTSMLLERSPLASHLWTTLVDALTTADSGTFLYYNEHMAPLLAVRNPTQDLLHLLSSHVQNIPQLPPMPNEPPRQTPFGMSFNAQVSESVLEHIVPQVLNADSRLPPGKRAQVEESVSRIRTSIEAFRQHQNMWEVRWQAAMAATVTSMQMLPAKINPVVRSLMASVKNETNIDLQRRSARTMSRLLDLTIKLNKPPVINEKIIKNLCTVLCSDPAVSLGDDSIYGQEAGILSLWNNTASEPPLTQSNRRTGQVTGKRGRKKKSLDPSIVDVMGSSDMSASAEDLETKQAANAARGAVFTLEAICVRFGADIFEKIPKLWGAISENFRGIPAAQISNSGKDLEWWNRLRHDAEMVKGLCLTLHIIGQIAPYLDSSLYERLATLLDPVAFCLRSPLAIVRHMASRCMSSLCAVITAPAMQCLITHTLPLMSDASDHLRRQGAAEAVFCILQKMQHTVLPYIIFLIIPVLRRMSDPDEDVRFICTNIFAQLVKLVPLESGVPDPEGFSKELVNQRSEERRFIGQLIGSEKVEQFELPVAINAELRSYQKEGVSWLAFLNRYGLHGILCDDMGLGKTLQSICMLSADHYYRDERYKKTQSPDSAPVPSLVVCPPTLTGHWQQEVQTFAPFLKPMIYSGNADTRRILSAKIPAHDIVITSYEVLRSDIDHLSSLPFNYCILDEGHVIKNPATKITQAAKKIQSMHRLILSGTPIQNNVLELWSLFDFLMPGFLGTERQFKDRFAKPILASRDAKSSSKEQEQGALALEALHKQVLPFLMRRMKEDVLHDLPPKIIQDYYCELSGLQKTLYEDFYKSQAKDGAEHILLGTDAGDNKSEKKGKTGHVFQALQYLRKLVNHPALVVNPNHPQFERIQQSLADQHSHIRDLAHAPKILALGQLLQDCGIGATDTGSGDLMTEKAVSPHRALIFVQQRVMLDIIESDLFKATMPSVTYMRLDGSTDPSHRHSIVRKFNEDASIDVLLLTTSVGGLGLTLTGADTVIFVEHDWNPMKDLQAMDRAHRIGQKRVVNVYRLITKGTLEEKIMGLQKFKLNIASSVINADNAGLRTMDTDQVLDLFSLGPEQPKKDKASDSTKASRKEILEELEELADDEQYEDLDMSNFLSGLK